MLLIGRAGTRIKTADWRKLAAVLSSSLLVIITVCGAFPFQSYDFPPQILLDELIQEAEYKSYAFWVDEGSWVAIEITSDVRLQIYISRREESASYHVFSGEVYHRIFTLGEYDLPQNVSISISPSFDGNIRMEIIDSFQSSTNSIHALLVSPWFLLLCLATLVLDVYAFVRWSRFRSLRGRPDRIEEKGFREELRVSRTYLALSWFRKLRKKLIGDRGTS
ncbi:MAG: hypothetical protein ACFFB7_07345 [Candidatus Sifarchaeia archaeon]